MKQRILSVLLALALMICVLPAAKAEGPEVAAPSAILMDAATGTILYEKNAHEKLAQSPACQLYPIRPHKVDENNAVTPRLGARPTG